MKQTYQSLYHFSAVVSSSPLSQNHAAGSIALTPARWLEYNTTSEGQLGVTLQRSRAEVAVVDAHECGRIGQDSFGRPQSSLIDRKTTADTGVDRPFDA